MTKHKVQEEGAALPPTLPPAPLHPKAALPGVPTLAQRGFKPATTSVRGGKAPAQRFGLLSYPTPPVLYTLLNFTLLCPTYLTVPYATLPFPLSIA